MNKAELLAAADALAWAATLDTRAKAQIAGQAKNLRAQAASAPEQEKLRNDAGLFNLALCVSDKNRHAAADAFWKYWKENGETHKHGYYESTWGAINKAIRLVGVVPHTYDDHTAPQAASTPAQGN